LCRTNRAFLETNAPQTVGEISARKGGKRGQKDRHGDGTKTEVKKSTKPKRSKKRELQFEGSLLQKKKDQGAERTFVACQAESRKLKKKKSWAMSAKSLGGQREEMR